MHRCSLAFQLVVLIAMVAGSWSAYPRESSSPCDSYLFDIEYFDKLLEGNATRVFVPDDQVHIKILEVARRDFEFRDFASLDSYLDESNFQGLRIILVPQGNSWSKLKLSLNGTRRLFHHLGIFPLAIDTICAFGEQTSATSDSLGGYHSHSHNGILEECYVIKSVEEHGREDGEEPWSIRQTGVYCQHDKQMNSDTVILLNPTRSLQRKLKAAQVRSGTGLTVCDLHTLILSHSTWQWRGYLSYWDSKLSQLVSKAHLSEVAQTKSMKVPSSLTIEYDDVQDIQVVHDRLNMASFILAVNAHICERFSNPSVGVLGNELGMQMTRAHNLLERARSASSLMQNIISFRGLDALKISSENSNEMARLAEADNKNMIELTKKSQRDAETLKKITILTMAYLPAAFVSQFMSMGYITVNSKKSPPSLNFAGEMWIFVVLSVILLALTLGLWRYFDSSRGQHGRKARPAATSGDEKV